MNPRPDLLKKLHLGFKTGTAGGNGMVPRGEVAQVAKEYVSDRSSVVGDRFKDLLNMDLGEFAEDAKQYTRINSGKALLLSAGAGFLLGLLIRGRR